MAQIIKFPAPASKFGYKRVKRRAKSAENPNQLHLFSQPTAKILNFAAELGLFEQALLLDEREDGKAEELYLQAINEQDCVADAYCNLGIIQSKQGNTTKAFDSFTTSLKHNPRHFEAHYNLGNMYFDLNDHRLAQLHYQIANEIDPSFPNAYFNLALVLAINNDLAAAVTALTTYQALVSIEKARHADELLENLRKSLLASKPRSGSAG
jgi:tetratricopeptide (TPR) repeat protein